jgi:hypothetical protein
LSLTSYITEFYVPVVGIRSKELSSHLLCRAGVISVVFCVAIFWTPPASSAVESKRSVPVLTFNLSSDSENGLLDPEKVFEFSVRLNGLKPRREEELVAIFESLAYPHRLVAFTPDEAAGDLTASTRFGPRPISATADGQPIRMEVVVARLRGLRLETVFAHVVYLTTVPAPSAPSESVSAPTSGTALLNALLDEAPSTDREGRPVQPLLPPEDIREEHLGEAPLTVSGPVYWKQIGDTVTRRWQEEMFRLRKKRVLRDFRVKFELYPGGFAQLIQIERSSGDPFADEVALRSVLSLHPFPPFPSDIHEPSIDVHLDLPGSKR